MAYSKNYPLLYGRVHEKITELGMGQTTSKVLEGNCKIIPLKNERS